MKTVTIIHKEVINQYFENGLEIRPSKEKKLLNILLNNTLFETKTSVFETEIAVIKYKNNKELENKFWETAKQFNIHPNDLIIKR